MYKVRLWKYAKLVLLCAALVSSVPATSFAETSSSANYKATETDFNAVSSSETCSAQYCAKVSIGDTSAEESKSATMGLTFGQIVDGEPSLDVIIEAGSSDLGKLTTERTGSKTLVVKVRSHLSDGYIIQIIGSAPSYKGRKLRALTVPSPSRTGAEQFGINVVANSVPMIGANPVQTPANQTPADVITDDYKVANSFKFVSGDTVARNLTATGQTDYTVSMIVNINGSTPAGQYASDLAAVVTPLY